MTILVERIGRTIADIIMELYRHRANGSISGGDFIGMVDDISVRFGLGLDTHAILKALDNVNQLDGNLVSGQIPVEAAYNELARIFSEG